MIAPLSFEEEWLWLVANAMPDLTAYNVPRALRIRGPLDVASLERAISLVVERQAVLRTTFRAGAQGDAEQVIAPPAPVPLAIEDLSQLASDDRHQTLRARLRDFALTPLDLRRDHLLRATLFKLRDEEFVLSLLTHHIVSDGASREILFREMITAYNAFAKGADPDLPPLPVQYADYSIAQRQRLRGDALNAAVEHWRAKLAGAPAALEISTDRLRSSALTFVGAECSVDVPAALASRLSPVAQSLGITLNMLMLAAWQCLLHRYTGQDDIVVGCPVSGRDEDVENLIGFFANVLPFRSSFAGDPTFANFAAQVAEVCIDAYEHAEMPLEPLMRALQRDGRPAQAPLFQAIMSLEHDAGPLPSMGPASVEVLPHEHEAAATDIALVMRASATGMRMAVQYRTDLFEPATAERILGHMLVLLEGAVNNPGTRVSELPLMTAAERELVVSTWNDTAAPYPAGRRIHELISEQAARTPDAVAVVGSGHRLTYAEIESRSTGLAARLRQLGVKPRDMVGVMAERLPESVIAILAILKAGGTYVPLDPVYPAERLAFIAQDSGFKLLVGRRPVATVLGDELASVVTLVSPDDSAALDAPLPTAGRGDDGAYVIFTSGSTGKPKGVLVTHENVTMTTWARVLRYPEPVSSYLLLNSFAFDSSVAGLYWTLIQGGVLVVPAEGEHLDAMALATLLRQERVSHLLAIPSFYQAMLDAATARDLVTLRVAMTGGDWCPRELIERHKLLAPNAGFYTEYGPTETTVWCSVMGIEPGEPIPPTITIGPPAPNYRMYILDKHGEPMPIGVPGEIYIGGLGVSAGYLNRPELNAQLFVADPYNPAPGSRMYKSGERGRWLANGEIQFLGRVDFQVKIRGHRVELGEIEAALMREPRVRDAVVLVLGSGNDKRLAGYAEFVEGAERHADDPGELRAFLRKIVPEYMVPPTIMVLDKLPLNANQKVDRKALPLPDTASATREYVAPADAVEETIATVMGDVLGVARVGANDDFFLLGGSSLVAMRLMARLGRALDVRLTWAMLFEASTVAGLAAKVRALLAESGIAARDEPIPPYDDEVAPLSFAQELLWLLDRSTPGLNAYNVPMAFRVSGEIDIPALEEALTRLEERHGPLRSQFGAETADGIVGQRVGPVVPIHVAPVDLRSVADSVREAELDTLVREAIRLPFDITRDVLLRATLYRLTDDTSCLLLVSHHIVFDEFSSYVVLREMRAFYAERVLGRPANLPPLPVRYGDYAAWQRASAERGALVHQLAYWRDRLRDLPTLELPTIGPRPVTPRFDGARRRFTIAREVLARFQALTTTHDVTLYMALLAGLKGLLHRYSGQDDIIVGAPITTRSREELEGLVGYFPNVLVLRTQLDGDPTFAELLARVRATCVGGFANQDVPQEKLVLDLRDAGRSATDPLVQVLFLLESRVAETHTLGQAELRRMTVDFGTAKFDITVGMRETDDGLGVTFEYRTDLFDDATIERMFGHLAMFLDGVSADPGKHISEIPLLTDAERAQVEIWNATARSYPADVTLHGLIEAQVARTPDAPAVADANAALTYRELDVRANQLAHHLRALGVTSGQLVGIAADRSVDMVVGLLGILKSGGAYVPIDPEYPADRVAFMIEDSGVRVLLANRRAASVVPTGSAAVVVLDDPATFASHPVTSAPRVGSASSPAYMIYTSGSTGRPKGALNAHSGIVNRLLWMQDEYRLTAADTVLQKTPFSFDVSVWEFFWPLMTGARLFMAQPGGHRDTGYLADTITSRGITVCHFVPSMLRAFLANPSAMHCTSLRDVMASGEALAPDLVAAFYATLPESRLHNLYGPTECAVDVTYWPCPATAAPLPSVPIGKPVANTQVYVLDTQRQINPVGVPGELYLAGRQVGLGYHGRPELTAERFVSDPFSTVPGARMYRTGDRARWRADGNIEYLGRLDFQVKVRGFRIELGEIENTLAQHPDVQDVAVMAHDDGGGDARLVAYIVPEAQPSTAATDEGVERWREVFDRTYSHAEETGDAVESGFNIAGWISSYDKKPIPAHEMREWVDRTCDRILSLKPKRVLELGCGTGLLLFRIAPHVEHYHGLDIAATALDGIRADPAFAPIRDRVTLAQARADETTDLPPASFDTIVINSVIQYFPSAEYLVQVLERAVRLVAPGGSIFVGDVRLLPLLETLHTSVALFDADDALSVADLRSLAQQRLWHESELVVDPAFFETLRMHVPRIAEVDVLLKRGAASNELTKFRGDVVLHIDDPRPPVPDDATPALRVETLDDVRALLRGEPAVLRLPDLADARVAADLLAREHVVSAPAQATVRELRASNSSSGGVDPEALATLHPSYDVDLLWPLTGTVGRFDAVLRHRNKNNATAPIPLPTRGVVRPWGDFVHHPAAESFSPEQVTRWRAHLGQTLPDYMIPSAFVRMTAMPLTPSGKTDRKALTPPVIRRPTKPYVAPRTPTESTVTALWAEVLRLERVGVDDGFLDLGGHSLLAMRIVGRIRREMGVSVGLDSLVRGETAAQFAAIVDAARASAAPASEPDDDFALAPISRDAYRRGTNAS